MIKDINRSFYKKIFNLIGLLVSIVLIVYLSYKFYTTEAQLVLREYSIWQYLLSFICIIICACGIYLSAYSWALFFGKKYNKQKMILAYLKTILWKYIPSNLMHYLGRHIYLKSIPHKKILINNFLDIYFHFSSGLILAASMMLITNLSLTVFDYLNSWQLILVISVFFIINLYLVFRKKLLTLKEILIINLGYFSFQLLFTVSFILLWAIFINNELDYNAVTEIGAIWLVGWVVGFISVGSPAGIGVRETIFLILLQPLVNSAATLIAFLFISRLVSILGEIAIYLFVVYSKVFKNKINL